MISNLVYTVNKVNLCNKCEWFQEFTSFRIRKSERTLKVFVFYFQSSWRQERVSGGRPVRQPSPSSLGTRTPSRGRTPSSFWKTCMINLIKLIPLKFLTSYDQTKILQCCSSVFNLEKYKFFDLMALKLRKHEQKHFVQIFVFVPCSPTYALDGTGKYFNSHIICTGTVFFFIKILNADFGRRGDVLFLSEIYW